MMVTTHALIGLLAATGLSPLLPGHLQLIGLAGIVGGIVPDLDMPFNHRKTLHYPFTSTVLALTSIGLAITWPQPSTLIAAAALTGFALHSTLDTFGGDLSDRPWKQEGEKAVYDHVRQEWITAQRYIRYDGSPEDLLLYTVLALPLYLLHHSLIQHLILAGFAISITYTAFRKEFIRLGPGTVHQSGIEPLIQRIRNRLRRRSKDF